MLSGSSCCKDRKRYATDRIADNKSTIVGLKNTSHPIIIMDYCRQPTSTHSALNGILSDDKWSNWVYANPDSVRGGGGVIRKYGNSSLRGGLFGGILLVYHNGVGNRPICMISLPLTRKDITGNSAVGRETPTPHELVPLTNHIIDCDK